MRAGTRPATMVRPMLIAISVIAPITGRLGCHVSGACAYYSVLKAITGSFFEAMRAGTRPATMVRPMLIAISAIAPITGKLATFPAPVLIIPFLKQSRGPFLKPCGQGQDLRRW